MIPVTIRPIDQWPDGWRAPKVRRPSPFRVTAYNATLDLLMGEAEKIATRELIIQVDLQPGDLRRDGHIRANADITHPGVIVTLDTRHMGVLVYPCDTFKRDTYGQPPSWQINLRAVALGLEALRKVDRYGIAARGQQYAGFGALPPARAAGPVMTADEAARLLARHGGPWAGDGPTDRMVLDLAEAVLRPSETADAVAGLYRNAAKRNHPDAGGNPALFRRLTEARDLLMEHAR
jgi:hypothetical protein